MGQTWLEKVKIYAVEVVLRKIGPVAAASIVSTIIAFLAAHQGWLEAWGITFGSWPLQWDPGEQPSGQVILIELGTISIKAIAGLFAAVVAFVMAAGHHGTALVKGDPQTGGLRATDKAPEVP